MALKDTWVHLLIPNIYSGVYVCMGKFKMIHMLKNTGGKGSSNLSNGF